MGAVATRTATTHQALAGENTEGSVFTTDLPKPKGGTNKASKNWPSFVVSLNRVPPTLLSNGMLAAPPCRGPGA